MEKPDKRIFQLALEKSGLPDLKPEECLHVGNRPTLDYQAARECGWNAFIITEKDPKEMKSKHPELDLSHCFGSAYQLHVNLLKRSGDKLPTPEQELS